MTFKMNRATQLVSRPIGPLAFIGAMVVSATVYAQSEQVQKKQHTLAITQTDSGDERVVEVSVRDGKPSVTINGKVLDDDRVRHDNGRIVLLDEEGNPMDDLPLTLGGFSDDLNMFLVRPGDASAWRHAMLKALESPRFEPPAVMIGIHMDAPGPALEAQLELEPGTATLVTDVFDDLAAAQAGLKQYDIIIAVDGKSPAGPDVIRGLLKSSEPGDQLELKVVHRGTEHDITLELQAWDAELLPGPHSFGVQIDLPEFGIFSGDRNGVGWFVDPRSNEFFHDIRGNERWTLTPSEDPASTKASEDANERIRHLESQLSALMEKLNTLLEDRDR